MVKIGVPAKVRSPDTGWFAPWRALFVELTSLNVYSFALSLINVYQIGFVTYESIDGKSLLALLLLRTLQHRTCVLVLCCHARDILVCGRFAFRGAMSASRLSDHIGHTPVELCSHPTLHGTSRLPRSHLRAFELPGPVLTQSLQRRHHPLVCGTDLLNSSGSLLCDCACLRGRGKTMFLLSSQLPEAKDGTRRLEFRFLLATWHLQCTFLAMFSVCGRSSGLLATFGFLIVHGHFVDVPFLVHLSLGSVWPSTVAAHADFRCLSAMLG